MMRIDIAEVLELEVDARTGEILRSRPESSQSRIHWWVQVFDSVVRDLERGDLLGVRGEILKLALQLLEAARSDGDLSLVDSLVVLVRLESFAFQVDGAPGELLPDRIGASVLEAIPFDRADVSAAIERERKFLMEDPRAWGNSSSDQPVVDVELDKLDDLRRLLDSAEKVASRIADDHLRDQISDWLSLREKLLHGPEVASKVRSMSMNEE